MLKLQSALPQNLNKKKEMQLQEQYNTCLTQINFYWLQRSRLQWSSEGDQNTTFFHATVAARGRRNSIHMIQLDDDTWTIDGAHIRKEFTNHFQRLYRGPEEALQNWPT